jgi:hypothetical protein
VHVEHRSDHWRSVVGHVSAVVRRAHDFGFLAADLPVVRFGFVCVQLRLPDVLNVYQSSCCYILRFHIDFSSFLHVCALTGVISFFVFRFAHLFAATLITVQGTNFGAVAAGTTSITFGSTIITTGITFSHTSLTFTSVALSGSANKVTISIRINGQATTSIDYNIAAPAITGTGINPSTGPTSGGTTVTLTGTY